MEDIIDGEDENMDIDDQAGKGRKSRRKRATRSTKKPVEAGKSTSVDADKNKTVEAVQKRSDDHEISDSDESENESVGSRDEGDESDIISSDNDSDEDDILGEDQLLEDSDKTAPAINAKVAERTNNRFSSKISKEQLKEKIKTYLRPKNCEKLICPKVNEKFWGKLRKRKRNEDLRLQGIQKSVIKSAISMANITSKIIEDKVFDKPQRREVVEHLLDGVAMAGNACSELSQIRKEKLRPCLKRKYWGLCSESNPTGKYLFGDDIQIALKDIQATEDAFSNYDYAQSNYNGSYNNGSYNNNYYDRQNQHMQSGSKNWRGQKPFKKPYRGGKSQNWQRTPYQRY